MDPGGGLTLHATVLAVAGQAVVITGKSGSGKSSLGLQLMSFGADLVADDTARIHRQGDTLVATAVPSTRGLIEARGVGILRARAAGPARVALAVDLDRVETERLPPRRSVHWIGVGIPLILGSEHLHFAAAVWQHLKAGRHA